MAGLFDGLFGPGSLKPTAPEIDFDPRETETYEEQRSRRDEERIELAKQRAADWQAKFDLYIGSLPEGQRENVKRLETAMMVMRRLRPGNAPTVNEVIKIAEYVEYGDTALVSAEATAEQIIRRFQ